MKDEEEREEEDDVEEDDFEEEDDVEEDDFEEEDVECEEELEDVGDEEREEDVELEEELPVQSLPVVQLLFPSPFTRMQDSLRHSVCLPQGILVLQPLGPGPLRITQVFSKHAVCSLVPQSRTVSHLLSPSPETGRHCSLIQARCLAEVEEEELLGLLEELELEDKELEEELCMTHCAVH